MCYYYFDQYQNKKTNLKLLQKILHFCVKVFGPVQSILKYNTLEEVIDRTNETRYGLAAGIFTSNLNNALQYAKHVESGDVRLVGISL